MRSSTGKCLACTIALALAGCITDPIVNCGAVSCSPGEVCVASGCATPGAAAACAGMTDETPCTADSITVGACVGGACRPTVCGDGRKDPTEACDDGNTVSGDGCSASCESDETCGNGIVDSITGEQCDSGRPGLSGTGCSSRCQPEVETWLDVSPVSIPVRAGARIAFDPQTGAGITFGGYTADDQLADTWLWDGTTWRPQTPATSPPGHFDYAFAYEDALHSIILFGGSSTDGLLDDTWKWDGANWTQLHPVHAPVARFDPVAGYDPDRQRVVLFGGEFSTDTWEFDGTDWTQAQPAMSPPEELDQATMAWDGVNHKTMLVDGDSGYTWEWDGTNWAQLTDATNSPPVHSAAALVWLAGSNEVMMFGGVDNGGNAANETWLWNGTLWSQYVPGPSEQVPGARGDPGIGYDSVHGFAVMNGGYTYDVSYATVILGDTWTFDGSHWLQVQTAPPQPPPIWAHGFAYDARRGRSVLFGGYYNAPESATWEYDASGWTLRTPATSPPPRRYAPLVYDSARGVSVVFAGADYGSDYDDTWEYDGTTWIERSPAQAPPARAGHMMAYDSKRGRIVMFGGYANTTNEPALADTWEYDGTTWTNVTPAGASPEPQGDAAMAYDAHRGRTVFFGVNAETWEWDGTTWTMIPTSVAPFEDGYYSLVYDPVERVVLLPADDGTWAWDGTTWTKRAVASAAPIRFGSPLVYDAIQRRAVRTDGLDFLYGSESQMFAHVLAALGPSAERCLLAGEDYDGDGLAGCADPDCWGRCAPLCPPGEPCPAGSPHCGDGTCDPVEDSLICPADCPAP